MNLDVFNLRQLQDTKTFLTLCKKKKLTMGQAIVQLEAEIQQRASIVSPEVLPRKELAKLCPKCNIQMRKEHKGKGQNIEAIWHCTRCEYSEYIGVVKGGRK